MEKQLLKGMLFLLLIISQAFAQNKVVTGTVTGKDDGLPIAGVSVTVKGTKSGTQTSIDGKYTVSVPSKSSVLVFSFIGYVSKEVAVGASGSINVTLEVNNRELTEVVVTAFGQKKEKKALGYAVSTVGKADLEARPETDIARVLDGKAPGVNVTNSSGLAGSGTNIVVRAISTITGSAQPLFVVDGVVFDSGTNSQSDFTYGTQTSSRFLDLDPNNIESVNVLKGLGATVLYGEAGRNGVIVITTKNGSTSKTRAKQEITVSQSYFATKAVLPEYNTEYGGGYELSLGLSFFSNWGAKFTNPPAIVAHPYDKPIYNTDLPQFKGATYEYKFYNSVHNFFKTGYSENTSVNVAGSAKDINYNVNYSHDSEDGYIPNNTLGKTTIGMGGTAKLSNKFTVSATLNYVKDNVASPPTSNSTGNNAQNASIFGNVLYTPTAIDLMNLPYEDPVTHGSVYYRSANDIQNPRWTLYNAFTDDNTQRVYGQISLKYDITKDLNVLYRYGLDYYNEFQDYSQNKGGIYTPTGILRTSSGDNLIGDQTVTINYNKDLTPKFNLSAVAGANDRDIKYSQTGLTSTDQLVYGLLNHGNFVNHTTTSENGSSLNFVNETRSIGIFASGTLGYDNYLYLTAAGRNSWATGTESKNRSIFYPSTSLAFVPTEAIESLKGNKTVNYLKVRVGYATSANYPSLYSTRASLFTQTKAFLTQGGTAVNINGINSFAPNPDLKPELSKEVEAGVEGKFFDNRLSLDLTFYRRVSDNQILTQSLDPATGYNYQEVNAGKVVNRGIEAAAGVTVVRSRNWRWQLDGQFTLNRSLVSDIPAAVGLINIAGFSNLGTIAKNGYPLGVIYGSYIERTNGQKTVGVGGDYIASNDYKVIGDPNPKWKTTGISTLSYKSLSFRMQWDYTYGGDMYSGTIGALLGRGVTKDTEFDRTKPLVLPGVLENGQPNNIQISTTQAYFDNNITDTGPAETAIYDATVIRLREASLSYVLPDKFFKNTPIGSISLTLSGSNLWYYAPNMPKYIHFDPDASGLGVSNGRGLEFLTGPSARRFGGSIRITF